MSKKRPGAKAGGISERESQDFIVRTLNQAAKRDRGKSKEPPHVRLYFSVMKSKAWLALSYPARVVYLEFLKVEWNARYHNQDRNRLEVSYSWLQKSQGMRLQTAARAFVELEALGFVEGPKSEERGGLFGRANLFRLSSKWQALENDGAALEKATARIAAYDEKRRRQRPSGYFKNLIEKPQAKSSKRIRKSPEGKKGDLEIEAAKASFRRRLQNTASLLESKGQRTN